MQLILFLKYITTAESCMHSHNYIKKAYPYPKSRDDLAPWALALVEKQFSRQPKEI